MTETTSMKPEPMKSNVSLETLRKRFEFESAGERDGQFLAFYWELCVKTVQDHESMLQPDILPSLIDRFRVIARDMRWLYTTFYYPRSREDIFKHDKADNALVQKVQSSIQDAIVSRQREPTQVFSSLKKLIDELRSNGSFDTMDCMRAVIVNDEWNKCSSEGEKQAWAIAYAGYETYIRGRMKYPLKSTAAQL